MMINNIVAQLSSSVAYMKIKVVDLLIIIIELFNFEFCKLYFSCILIVKVI